MKNITLLLAILSIMLFAGCRTVAVIPISTHATVTHTRHILPPHAPAHGYRYHHHDYDLEYDSDFGAYVVLGYDGIYFSNNLYLRFYDGYWQTSSRLDGRWHDAEHRHIPDRLRGHRRYDSHNKNHRRHSPPPHAPAHGYRRHHHDVNMTFDSRIGAYVVIGYDGLFFSNDRYMRFYDGYWHESDRRNGKWRRAKDRHVPHKLRKARKKGGLSQKMKNQSQSDRQERRSHRDKHESRERYESRDRRESRDRHEPKNRHEPREQHESRDRHGPKDKHSGGLSPKMKKQAQENNQKKKNNNKKDKNRKKSKKGDKKKKQDKDDDRDDERHEKRDEHRNGFRN